MVGVFTDALNMLAEIDFPEELVINSSLPQLDSYFRGRGLAIFDEEEVKE